jgi:hypothetical protein
MQQPAGHNVCAEFGQIGGGDCRICNEPTQWRRQNPQPWRRPRSRIGARAEPEDVVKPNVSLLTYPPDPSRYPLFAQTRPVSCVLHAGQALYIPARWWHWITSYDRNLALNFWHLPERPDAPTANIEASSAVPTTTPAEFPRWFSAGAPVVLESPDIAHWRAVSAWSDDYLLEHVGASRREVGISPDPFLFPLKGPHQTRVESMTFGEYLQRSAESPDHHYLARDEAIPRQLAADWSVPECWRAGFSDQRYRVAFWMTRGGAEGVTSALHYDDYENLLVQVAGRKRVFLFSPDQGPLLYAEAGEMLRPGTPA